VESAEYISASEQHFEIFLKDGRVAQVKVKIETDKDEFDR